MEKNKKIEKKLKRSKEIYERVKDELGLNGSVNEQIGQLILECCDIQHEICNQADTIKITNFDKALELIQIDKGTWNEFVNITAKKYYGRLKDKAVDKYEDDCHKRRHIANLKQSFYDSYLSDEPLKVLDETDFDGNHAICAREKTEFRKGDYNTYLKFLQDTVFPSTELTWVRSTSTGLSISPIAAVINSDSSFVITESSSTLSISSMVLLKGK